MPCFAGDDSIYPMFTSPPLNHSFYKGRLEFAHGLGMNFVRHHSHILPIEYFNAGEKRHFLRCHLYKNAPFHQDRLGTNIGKALKKE